MKFLLVPAFLVLVGTAELIAEARSDKVDHIAQDLESVLADLATSQQEMITLRARLAELETLADVHQAELATQSVQLADFQKAVGDLVAHEQKTLDFAQRLQTQLNDERQRSAWITTAVVVATLVAVTEGVILVWTR